MGLVDYSSNSASSSDGESVSSGVNSGAGPPPAKRRKPEAASTTTVSSTDTTSTAGDQVDGSATSLRDNRDGKTKKPSSSSLSSPCSSSVAAAAAAPGAKSQSPKSQRRTANLPPLPDSFHDLYASSVRQSVSDDPSLHQGRKRAIPHVVGNWPSHIYVEWYPTTQEHATLTNLLSKIQRQLGDSHKLTSFLTSDLNAPLPLHISLSRPLALTTATKDAFLEKLTHSLRAFRPPGSTSVPGSSFALTPTGLAFYKSPDSPRTFLVLRVANALTSSPVPGSASNPQLRDLLRRCNALVASYGHQTLYGPTRPLPSSSGVADGAAATAEDPETAALIDNAFHVSIAWTFDLPAEGTCLRTYRVLKTEPFRDIRKWKIGVGVVKAKIGNVVTSIPLVEARSSRSRGSSRGGSGSPAGYRSGSSSGMTPLSQRESSDPDDSPWR